LNTAPTPKSKPDTPHETGRIEAFSDGVLAIVITLLVLELKVPDAQESVDFSLLHELLRQWPTYVAYLASFLFVLVMWINHHRLFSLIHRSDDYLLILNGLLLMGISLFPFVMALVARYLEHPQQRTAFAVFNGLSIFNSIFYNLLWRYAAHNNRLFSSSTDPALARIITRQYGFGPLLYFAIFLIGLWNGPVSLALSVGMGIYFALPNRVFNRFAQSAEG
jgi:uncharacterized membrane protein